MKRVVIVAEDSIECTLIAAQLQEASECRVESAMNLSHATVLVLARVALVIVDWSSLEINRSQWAFFMLALRGAPLLILASRLDRAQIEHLGINPALVMYRPFTVGNVVKRAYYLLGEGSTDG